MRAAVSSEGGNAWAPPISLLPKPLLKPERPLVALLVAWLLAFIHSLAMGASVTKLLPNLGQPELPVVNGLALSLVVIMAPVVETLIMAAVLSLLLRLFPPTVAVILSALGWGIAHSMAAPAWGLVIWWPFLIFSTLYVTWRKRSLLAALAMPAAAHGLHNLLPAISLLAMHRS